MTGATHPFLSYAFRPFFLLNGVFAMLVIALWVFGLHGLGPVALTGNGVLWHGHEMLFGFVLAAIAGFVLTAVATWTGRPPVQGVLLASLVLAWLAGRLVMLFDTFLPAVIVATVDLLFALMLSIVVGREIIGARNRRNYPVVIIVVLLAVMNLRYHLGVQGLVPGVEQGALLESIHIILVLVTIIAGRIVPSFTANWLRARGATRLPRGNTRLDILTILATVLTGLAATIAFPHPITGVMAAIAAVLHGYRLSGWRGLETTSEPLLFVLHVAYLWLPIGYGLLALSAFGQLVPFTAALHALAMGSIGSMILAVTTRVALGHTGRALQAARLTVVAYGLLMLAVLTRVLGPVLAGASTALIDLAAVGWVSSFALFTWVYWPILTGPRADA
ncbi:MAG: NnrS family protein [Gammaproteobacteria bacterium]|nr:NnrS family protein [Gammaproteobacteria bacterium]